MRVTYSDKTSDGAKLIVDLLERLVDGIGIADVALVGLYMRREDRRAHRQYQLKKAIQSIGRDAS